MISEVHIYRGSKKGFADFVKSRIDSYEDTIPFMELIQHYNARLRPNESGVDEEALFTNLYADNCIVKADDYGSVLPHVLSNFVGIVTLNYNIKALYLHNPPKRVEESILTSCDNVSYNATNYPVLTRDVLKTIAEDLDSRILGQKNCKKQILSGFYRLMSKQIRKPLVVMMYGPSGVGKTESAKCISESLGGELLRIQFSMMQSEEAFNYVFGAEHSKNSFARDLLGRESNVVLIDEFDKVNTLFYNAFYQLFDEGEYVDTNYRVEMNDAIIICTSNFMNEEEIVKALGPAMYSRINICVRYEELLNEQKLQILNNWFDFVCEGLNEEEKQLIDSSNIRPWFNNNVHRYDNIRLMKTKIENAIFEKLTEEFILK